MKRTIILIALAAFPLLFGCERHEVTPQDDEMITTHLGLSIEGVSIFDEVLTRAEDPHPYYAISVSEFNTNTNTYAGYAQGIFDDVSQMVLSLRKSKKYAVSVALLYDYLEKGYSFRSGYVVTNSFNYTNTYPTNEIHGGDSTPFTKGISDSDCFEGDAYYGFISDYQPSTTCPIELKRITSAFRLVVNGINKGRIYTSIGGHTINLAETNEINTECSFIKMVSIYDRQVYDSASIAIVINYYDEDNKPTTLYQDNVVFKRAFRKVIVLNLQEDNSPISSTLSLSIENVGIQDEATQTIDATI